MLLDFYHLSLIDTNYIAALTFYLIPLLQRVVLFYPILPAMQQSAFTDLEVFKYFAVTLSAPHYYHRYLH